ncbi:MAG: uracil-DNA glycosylase family protein [Rickettsiales bacterium]|nr:uracil-DNA glycosylase family protein [Rickettsiales bacterium]
MKKQRATTSRLMSEINACTICAEHLPLGPRPVFQFNPKAKILIAGQAPGVRVHETGIPFNDPSGDRLRAWVGVSREIFYDAEKIAILPMGFCYPGTGKSGDLPPRPECAPAWRNKLLAQLPNIELTLILGQYALDWHLGERRKENLTETVRAWKEYWPQMLVLPHPSPRNNIWLKKNLWFEKEVIPQLQKKVGDTLELSSLQRFALA